MINGVMGISTFIVLSAFAHPIARLLTSDEEMARETAAVLPLIGAMELADSQVSLFYGIFRASGLQATGAVLNFAVQVRSLCIKACGGL